MYRSYLIANTIEVVFIKFNKDIEKKKIKVQSIPSIFINKLGSEMNYCYEIPINVYFL
jgi:hypothetical protein